ncbi:hypothetical protein [Rhodohalobacter halophilus]|uniref:hypothetical protein n=1 Tax=Rhodohalobacter halophilus TaxID=1812810 RepID=UPI00083F58F5|nr:hypothetical protein [Rhodohalobacter halophilus]
MTEEIRLTRDIHNFVRGHLSLDESLRLLEEIIESEEWMTHLEIDMLLYDMARKKREKVGVKPPIPIFY